MNSSTNPNNDFDVGAGSANQTSAELANNFPGATPRGGFGPGDSAAPFEASSENDGFFDTEYDALQNSTSPWGFDFDLPPNASPSSPPAPGQVGNIAPSGSTPAAARPADPVQSSGALQAARVPAHGKKRVFRCEKNGHNCGLVFAKNQHLLRHVARATKKYQCQLDPCASKSPQGERQCFGSKSDLKRHYSDIHKIDMNGQATEEWPCPFTSCDRHSDPFPRKVNLDGHLKTRHGRSTVPPTVPATALPFSPLPAQAGHGVGALAAAQLAPDDEAASSMVSDGDSRDPIFRELRTQYESLRAEKRKAQETLEKFDFDLKDLEEMMEQRLRRVRAREQQQWLV